MCNCNNSSGKREMCSNCGATSDNSRKTSPPMQLFIDSANRTDPLLRDPAYCSVSLNTALKSVKALKLESFSMPNTMYTLPEGHSSFTLTTDSLSPTITITPGFYTMDSLTTALNAAFDTYFGAGYLVASYSTVTMKWTFAFSGGDFVSIYCRSRYIAAALGFPYTGAAYSLTSVVVGLDRVVTSASVAVLSLPKWIHLSVSTGQQLFTGSLVDVGDTLRVRGVSLSIPLTQNSMSLVYNSNDVYVNEPIQFPHAQDILRLDFAFWDSYGNTLSFNGCDWVMVFDVLRE